jgi:hypothetical protein
VVRGRELKIEAARSREDPILQTDHAERHPVLNSRAKRWCGSLGTALATNAGVNASFGRVEHAQQRPFSYERLSVPGARGSRAGPLKDFYE